MSETLPKWWYALVVASPKPEDGEAVNVGLIVGDGRPERMEYLPGLPRLKGLVARDEGAVLEEILASVSKQVAAGIDLPWLESTIGPQLRISAVRQLYEQPDERVIRLLTRRLLKSPRVAIARQERREARRQTDLELDRVIGGVIPALGLKIERRVSPDHLYDRLPEVFSAFKVPTLARALRSSRRDVLIDSVLVRAHKTTAAIHAAVVRAGRAFWYYSRFRKELEGSTGRQIKTIGLLLDGVPNKPPEVQETRRYIAHLWQKDADIVFDADRPEDVEALREQVGWLFE